jgi:tetratricopeptide (TPR) repeat protein
MARRTKSEELLEFEISFYEKLLRRYPDFTDVLVPLANAYTRRGFHEKGLEIDLRLTRLRGHDPLNWYNLACSYSLLQRVDEAAVALRRSLELGYRDLGYLQKDPDLRNLRQSPHYRELLSTFAASLAGRPAQAASGGSIAPSP